MNPRSPWSAAGLTGPDLSALLATALSLKQAAAEGRPLQPLRGKNIAVMGVAADDVAAHNFARAAQALGAQVAHIHPGAASVASPETARVLARLYDAIECEGMPLDAVQELQRSTGRPVFNGMGQATQALRELGDLMTQREHGSPITPVDNLHYALQALLCSAVT